MVRIKICGITNLEDAIGVVVAGCDALGFVFYKKSPRYISPDRARNISRIIPRTIKKVGVFVNSPEKTIKQIARLCRLDILQFHGHESPEFCKRFKGYKIIKAFRIGDDKINLENILRYKTFAYLFDTFLKSKAGGTGKRFDWSLIKDLDNLRRPIFLSGGLTARNVTRAIRTLRPDWVDVSSSTETSPGKKDFNKVKDFIEAVRR